MYIYVCIKILKHCICAKVRFILDVTSNIEYIIDTFSRYFKEKLQELQSAQYTYFSKNDVLTYAEKYRIPNSDKVYHQIRLTKIIY